MQRVYRASCLAAALVLLAASAWATTAVRLSKSDLTAEADLIVIGRGVESRSAWVGRVLVTQVTVSVTESLKGSARDTITVVLPGGIDANRKFPISMSYPGAPAIRSDEDVFLFLGRDDELNGYTVLGFSQGKFSIVEDPQGNKLVTRDLTGVRLQSGSGVVRGAVSHRSLPEFRSEIESYLAEQPEGRRK
ncbi:MAG: hypothetical protein ACRD5G_06940 [Candidatus Acidiferrales bacterium]